MGRIYKKDDIIWKKLFTDILKFAFSLFNLNYQSFCDSYAWSSSTVRYWFNGRSLPQLEALENLKDFLVSNIVSDESCNIQFYDKVSQLFSQQGESNTYYTLRRIYPIINNFVGEVLSVCRDFSKHDFSFSQLSNQGIAPTGKTQAVVFSFDGTLTTSRSRLTVWERIGATLGYDCSVLRNLHREYCLKEITYTDLCNQILEKFSQRGLRKKGVKEIARNIRLIKGVKKTFCELENRNIKIYILSGSILLVIRSVLGELCQYVEEIKANDLRFDENGLLVGIVSTKYDYEQKPNFICEIAAELNIAPQDILFVGDSLNDKFAYTSGAKTLCINPNLTDTSDRTVWNNCIPVCSDLSQILAYV